MALLMKEKTPGLPEQAPKVIEARKQKEAAIQVQAEARAKRDGLRRTLADPAADPAEKIRARLGLPDAEAAAEIAELNASARQADETIQLRGAVEAWRPVWEERYRGAIKALYTALENAASVNEEARKIWASAYEAGIELPVHYWSELLPETANAESLLSFRRKQAEGWT